MKTLRDANSGQRTTLCLRSPLVARAMDSLRLSIVQF